MGFNGGWHPMSMVHYRHQLDGGLNKQLKRWIKQLIIQNKTHQLKNIIHQSQSTSKYIPTQATFTNRISCTALAVKS
jgi:hypothetical protein